MSAKSIDELWHHGKDADALRRGDHLYTFLHDHLEGLVRSVTAAPRSADSLGTPDHCSKPPRTNLGCY